jgi:Rrf2 family iron-sulfur cluster assembly transcriptional regulator
MNLTTKARYAVMAMVDLALQTHDNPVSLSDISSRQGIAVSYLEQIFMKLRKAGLVRSVRGPGGGYKLVHALEDVAISDIVAAVDEAIKMTRCSGKDGCAVNKSKCLTHNLWEGLGGAIYTYLNNISLRDVCVKE